MNHPGSPAPQTETPNEELTEDALDAVSGGVAYIKIDGIQGELRSKDRIEYGWKVEPA